MTLLMQIVLGYVLESKALAAARLACRSWRQAAATAPCVLRVMLPSNQADMRNKLAMLLQVKCQQHSSP